MASQWLNKYAIANDKDKDSLETDAAIHEFGPNKMPREQAEQTAHASYVKKQREQAASHHLMGQKMATAAGDSESAVKHGALYKLHVEALGHNSADVPPPEISANSQNTKNYKYKSHRGDLYAVNDLKQSSESSKKPKK